MAENRCEGLKLMSIGMYRSNAPLLVLVKYPSSGFRVVRSQYIGFVKTLCTILREVPTAHTDKRNSEKLYKCLLSQSKMVNCMGVYLCAIVYLHF